MCSSIEIFSFTSQGYEVITCGVEFPDLFPPEIIHSPVDKVHILGNKIVISGQVKDDSGIDKFIFYYKKSSTTTYNSIEITNLGYSYEFKFVIPKDEVTLDGIDYYLFASDKSFFNSSTTWKSAENPQRIIVTQIVEKTIGQTGGIVALSDGNPEDGETYVSIPANVFDKPTKVSIKQIYPIKDIPEGNGLAASKIPVAVYEFGPSAGRSGIPFGKPVEIALLYFDLDNDGKPDGTNFDESELGVFWWDGFEWRLVGGKVDKEKNVVYAKAMHFSLYALFPVGEISPEFVRPLEKIITPASKDGYNDFAFFQGLTGDFEIKIFDITGKVIRTLKNNYWFGEDESNRVVESGVYIYQVRVNGKLISGTIVVAK